MLSTKLLEEGCFVTVIDKLNYDPDSLNHLYLNNNFHFINEDINKNKNTYEKTKIVTKDDFGNETATNSPTTDAIDNIVAQNKLAGEISGNVLNDDLYLKFSYFLLLP